MNDHDQERAQRRHGRCFCARAKGDSIEELENAALLQAQEFFGAGVPLEVDENYMVLPRSMPSDMTGRYAAHITVWPAEGA